MTTIFGMSIQVATIVIPTACALFVFIIGLIIQWWGKKTNKRYKTQVVRSYLFLALEGNRRSLEGLIDNLRRFLSKLQVCDRLQLPILSPRLNLGENPDVLDQDAFVALLINSFPKVGSEDLRMLHFKQLRDALYIHNYANSEIESYSRKIEQTSRKFISSLNAIASDMSLILKENDLTNEELEQIKEKGWEEECKFLSDKIYDLTETYDPDEKRERLEIHNRISSLYTEWEAEKKNFKTIASSILKILEGQYTHMIEAIDYFKNQTTTGDICQVS